MRTNAIHLRSRALPVALATSMAALAMVATPAAEASAPPSPPGCEATTTTVSNTTPLTLTDNGTVSSQVTVASADAFVADIDVFTDLHHTRSGDIQMTLTSPNNKIVTLTTNNGGITDDVFAGTTWDDDADPGGQVPFPVGMGLSGNDGVAEDHPYVDGVVATPLAPEEPLGAFIGTATPNGTWTLTISDVTPGDVGTLDNWSLTVTTYPVAPGLGVQPPVEQPTDVSILDVSTVSSEISMAGFPSYLLRASVVTDISHGQSQDIDMTLESPAGTVVTLTSDHGIGDDTYSPTNWLDAINRDVGQVPYAGNPQLASDHPYVLDTGVPLLAPVEATAAFIGENPNGTWTLRISDDSSGDVGTLNSWSLQISSPTNPTVACTVPPCDGQVVTMAGTEASETITGTSGNDVIAGLGGSDTINGGGGNDVICGGNGNDILDGGTGADVFDGGSGTDTATYAGRGSVKVSIDGVANDGNSGDGNAQDNVRTTVEKLTGGVGNDTLVGSSAANVLSGGDGNDVLDGGTGPDRFSGGTGTDTVTYAGRGSVNVSLDGVANDGNSGDGASATARDSVSTSVENLIGGNGNDTLRGSSLANRLTGGLGADQLFGLGGTDTLIAKDGVKDTKLDGGAGTDAGTFDSIDPARISVP